jgi:20S proteasome alpha/beta subunit
MTYQVPNSEIVIDYDNTNYVVTLTPASDPSGFRVKSPIDGSLMTVDADTAAHLFGAEIAVTTLGRLYGPGQLTQIQNSWANVLDADSQIVALSAINNAAGSFSGLLLGGLFTAGAGTLVTSANAITAFTNLTEGMAPSVIELGFATAATYDATHLLNQASGEFNAIQSALNSNRNSAISYDAIKQAIDNSLVSLATGNAASQAASNIPVINQSIWDDVFDFAGSLASSLTDGITKVTNLLGIADVTLLGNTQNAADLIDTAGDLSDLKDYIATVSSVLAASDSAKFPELTDSGLVQAANALKGMASVSPSSHAPSYSITPNPTSINENAHTVTFTVTRSDTSQQATVYASTIHDQGTDNPNNLYYDGISNQPITFAPGASTATVQLTINDLGLTSGAEAFRLIVQQNATDPLTTLLASDTFTIVNNDSPPASTYTITPGASSFNEKSATAIFTITRTNFAQAAKVYVSTVHDQGTDNPNGDYYYNGLLNQTVAFAAGASTTTVQLHINDPGLLSGSENFRLIVQQNSTDPITSPLASDNFTIVNNDTGIIANASVNEPTNTTFLLSPFLSVPAPASGKTISLVNFINTHTGPGELTIGGSPTSGNTAVAYSAIGQVGFATGSITGSDKVEMYATYSDGSVSNTVDLTVNIQSALIAPPPPPLNSSGPVVNGGVAPLQVTVGKTGVFSISNLSASDSAYPDPSQITYTITGSPTLGTILDNGQFADSFTQADINAVHVVYQAGFPGNLASETTDSFTYVVSDPSFRQSGPITASLKIEPLPPPPQGTQPFVDINSFQTVPEGGQIFVTGNRFSVQNLHVADPNPNFPSFYTQSVKDASIVYTVVQGPAHGELVWLTNNPTLWIPGQPSYFGQQVTQFTQNDLNNGWFAYENNLTSGASDSFSFTVNDGFGGAIGLTTATIPIQPVNPLHLDINAGVFVTTGGQNIISPDWLRADDAAPNAYPGDQPVFEVIQAPSHGALLVSGQVASTFTMLDIDRELVTYKQDGSATSSDQFTLALASDAYGNSISDFVVPVTIGTSALDHNTGAVVAIGQSETIGGANLHVGDPGLDSGNPNADPASILVYTITALPQHGTLSINGTTLTVGGQFTQDQIDNNLLTYTSTAGVTFGAGPGSDSFGFSISDSIFHNNFGSGTFDITLTDTNGGRIFTGSDTPETFFSGPGNNWIEGGSGTTVSYALVPSDSGGVIVNLATGSAANGFGGVDTLVNVHSVVGSSNGDILKSGPGANLFIGGPGNDIIDGSGNDTAGYSGAHSDYTVQWIAPNEAFVIDNRPGSPDGTDTVSNVKDFSFSDGTYTFDQIATATLEFFGATSLVVNGNEFFLYANFTTTGPELKYGGTPWSAGQWGAWMPIGAEATATGYEVAFKVTGADQYTVWNTDSSGNITTDPIGTVSGTSTALQALEPSFHQDLNSDGLIGPPAPTSLVIESFGSTSLVAVGNDYFLYANGTTTGPELKYGGTPWTAGQWGTWTPIGAEATASGYEVAFKVTGADAYTVWNTDSSGNITTDSIGTVSGSSTTLEALETSFHQDLNGDGMIGAPVVTATTIEAFGATALVQAGTDYFLYANSTMTGPELEYGGTAFTAGEWGAWTPIGGEAIGGGYEVAFKVTGADAYTVWDTDSNGNITTDPIGTVSGSSTALEALETSFHQDLNGDGMIGPSVVTATTIESFGATALVQTGNDYFLNPVGGGTGPLLQYGSAPLVAGEWGAWTPIGAEATAAGYEVAFKVAGANAYTVWDTDSSGNITTDSIGTVTATSTALELLETSFHQDLNLDGTTGIPGSTVIETSGSTSLVGTGSNFFLDANSGGTGPELKYGGAAWTSGEWGAWTPIGAEAISTGYEVAFKIAGSNAYTVWDTDSSGNITTDPIGTVTGTSAALEALEPSFHQDLNGDGLIGAAGSSASQSAISAPTTIVAAPISGDTILSGSSASDSFVFGPRFGNDTITNFQLGTDQIQIDHSLFATVADLLAHTADDAKGNAVISISADQSIHVQGVSTLLLQQHLNDFHIV